MTLAQFIIACAIVFTGITLIVIGMSVDHKRYFFISYSGNTKKGTEQIGNMYFTHSDFPSNEFIKNYLIDHDTTLVTDQIVVLNIFEFKNKKDFNEFMKK